VKTRRSLGQGQTPGGYHTPQYTFDCRPFLLGPPPRGCLEGGGSGARAAPGGDSDFQDGQDCHAVKGGVSRERQAAWRHRGGTQRLRLWPVHQLLGVPSS
jgi:hypothetical protein